MLSGYLSMLDSTEYALKLGVYDVQGSLVDYVTEQDPNSPAGDMRTFTPSVSQKFIIGIDELPASWQELNEGELIAQVQPLNVTSDGLSFKTKGVRVGRLMGEKAYLEVLLAEPDFSEEQIDEALRWETWTRKRFMPDGGKSPVTRQPTGQWVDAEVELSFVTETGNGIIDLGIRNAEAIARHGELDEGDRLYSQRAMFEVYGVKPEGEFDRVRMMR